MLSIQLLVTSLYPRPTTWTEVVPIPIVPALGIQNLPKAVENFKAVTVTSMKFLGPLCSCAVWVGMTHVCGTFVMKTTKLIFNRYSFVT